MKIDMVNVKNKLDADNDDNCYNAYYRILIITKIWLR